MSPKKLKIDEKGGAAASVCAAVGQAPADDSSNNKQSAQH